GDLSVEELTGELMRAAHHVRDDDADLAAEPVIAIGHRRHEPLVLGDDEALVAILGERREDARLRRARIGDTIFDPPVLPGLEQQHPRRAGDGLAHGRPRCQPSFTRMSPLRAAAGTMIAGRPQRPSRSSIPGDRRARFCASGASYSLAFAEHYRVAS